jgi:hypothetical protein
MKNMTRRTTEKEYEVVDNKIQTSADQTAVRVEFQYSLTHNHTSSTCSLIIPFYASPTLLSVPR